MRRYDLGLFLSVEPEVGGSKPPAVPFDTARSGHAAEVLRGPHPAPVDPVLQRPHPGAFRLEPSARGDGVTFAGRDESEVAPLRAPGFSGLAARAPAQILGERRTGAHGKDARLFARRLDKRGAVA